MSAFLESGIHWKIVNFLLFAGILFHALKRPVREFWHRRAEAIRSDLDEANRLRQEAGRQVLALEARRNRLSEEIEALVRDLKAEGCLERDKMIGESTHQAEKTRQAASRMMKQEVSRVRERLKRETAGHAIQIAEGLIRRGVRAADQERMTGTFLGELEGCL